MNRSNESAPVFDESSLPTGHRTANPVARFVSWNRRKEIMVGTRENVHADSARSRRTFKIAQKLGARFALYAWMLNGLRNLDYLKFYIDHAAEQVGINEKTVDRQLASMESEGWITRKNNLYGGNRSYSTYTLHPINELIGDDGHGPSLTHFRPPRKSMRPSRQRRDTDVPTLRDTDVPTKRAMKPSKEQQAPLSSSFSHPSGAKQAEAGRAGASPAAAPAGFATKGDTHSQKILTWIQQNEKTFAELGFKEQRSASLVQDILRYTDGDDERWTQFVEDIWPLLLEQCRASDWLSEKRCRVGLGWLFLQSINSPAETNLQVFMFSQTYTSLTIPDVVWKPGNRVRVYGHPTTAIIRGFRPASLRVYRVYGETLTDSQAIEDNTYEANLSQLSDAAASVLASVDASDGLGLVEQPAPVSEEQKPDDEDDIRLKGMLREMEDAA